MSIARIRRKNYNLFFGGAVENGWIVLGLFAAPPKNKLGSEAWFVSIDMSLLTEFMQRTARPITGDAYGVRGVCRSRAT